MNPCTTAFAVTSLACSLFQCLPEEEIEVLAASLSQLGDTLATMLAQEALNSSSCSPSPANDSE